MSVTSEVYNDDRFYGKKMIDRDQQLSILFTGIFYRTTWKGKLKTTTKNHY